MSDTRRKHDKVKSRYKLWSWDRFRMKYPEAMARLEKVEERRQKLENKGADGTSRKAWRFDSAKEDGSGKVDTFDETGAGRRGLTKVKRQVSKDTRRYGKKIIKGELDDV